MPDGGLSVAAITSALNFGYRSVQTGYELQAVPEQTQKLLATIETSKRDIKFARSLRRKKSNVLNGQEKAYIDEKITDTEAALDGLEALVEAARVDMMTKFGQVSAWNRALWVVREGPQVGTSLARLNVAIIALNTAVSVMSLREGDRNTYEQHFTSKGRGDADFPSPNTKTSDFMQLRERRRKRSPRSGTTTTSASERWVSDEYTELGSEMSTSPQLLSPSPGIFELEGSHALFTAPRRQAPSRDIPLSLRPGPQPQYNFPPVEDPQNIGPRASWFRAQAEGTGVGYDDPGPSTFPDPPESNRASLRSRAAWFHAQAGGSDADLDESRSATVSDATESDGASIRLRAAWFHAQAEGAGLDYDDQRPPAFGERQEAEQASRSYHGRQAWAERTAENPAAQRQSWIAYRASMFD
jgi:hypothetical protein